MILIPDVFLIKISEVIYFKHIKVRSDSLTAKLPGVTSWKFMEWADAILALWILSLLWLWSACHVGSQRAASNTSNSFSFLSCRNVLSLSVLSLHMLLECWCCLLLAYMNIEAKMVPHLIRLKMVPHLIRPAIILMFISQGAGVDSAATFRHLQAAPAWTNGRALGGGRCSRASLNPQCQGCQTGSVVP